MWPFWLTYQCILQGSDDEKQVTQSKDDIEKKAIKNVSKDTDNDDGEDLDPDDVEDKIDDEIEYLESDKKRNEKLSYQDKKEEEERQHKEKKDKEDNKTKVVINPNITEHINHW